MSNVLNITLPFFLLIFIGSMLNYCNFLNPHSTKLLSKLAFYLLMPPMVFLNLADSDVALFFNFKFVLLYETCTILLFLFAIPIGRMLGLPLNSIGMFGLISSYPNYGYIGIPMTLVALGPISSEPMALILFSNTLMLLLLTSTFMAIHEGHGSLKKISSIIAKGLLLNPLIIAVIAGIFFASLKVTIPVSVDTTLEMLSQAAPPVALIALGASLKFEQSKSVYYHVLSITFMKLIIHPALIFLVFSFWPIQDKVWLQTAIICASLPVAANVFILANTYNNSIYESTNSIFFSTLISVITVPAILFVLLDSY